MNTQHDDNNDKVWELLDNASQQEASPLFSRNVMRAVRLEEAESSTPWWKMFTNMKALVSVGAVAACAIAVVSVYSGINNEIPTNEGGFTGTQDPITEEVTTDIPSELISDMATYVANDEFVSEILVNLVENPDLLSADEMVAIVSF